MATPESSTSLTVSSKPVEGEYILNIREVDASGTTSNFPVTLPNTLNWKSELGIVTRAALAKRGRAAYVAKTLAEIVNEIIYADSLGLSFEQGDVYSIDGRMNTTANAKIKYALNTGKIKGYNIEIKPLEKDLKLPWKTKTESGVFETKDLEATVTVHVKDWEIPFVYKAKLSEWFVGQNPNWRSRPDYMLGQNAAGKALNLVVPMGGAESDEAPPAVIDAPVFKAKESAA